MYIKEILQWNTKDIQTLQFGLSSKAHGREETSVYYFRPLLRSRHCVEARTFVDRFAVQNHEAVFIQVTYIIIKI